MSRKVAILALLVLSLSAYARTRTVTPPFSRPAGGAASGYVHSVEGNLIRLAGGLIEIDATGAQVVIGRGRIGSVAEIEPGMLLAATIQSENPLRASFITASRAGDAGFSAAVQAVDTTARTLTILGHTIHVDDDTSFGGILRHDGTPSLADILPNQLVYVQVDAVHGQLLARDILVMSPVPPQIQRIRGTVKTIGTDRWTIDAGNEDVMVLVNAQTKINGSPKTGDVVEVIYNVDTANNKVAIAIYKVQAELPPNPFTRIQGSVTSIAGTKWVVTSNGQETSFVVDDDTKFLPSNIEVGDVVHVIAQTRNGVLTALSVVKVPF